MKLAPNLKVIETMKRKLQPKTKVRLPGRLALAWLAALALLLSACGGAASEKVVTVTEANQDGVIKLAKGETLEVRLPGNPTTGYTWEVAQIDRAVLDPLGEPEFIQDDGGGLGAGGKIVLRFKASQAGECFLRLDYRRAWEVGVAPEQVFQLLVVVNEAK